MTQLFTGNGRHFQELQAVALDQESLPEIIQRIKLQPRFLGEQLIVIGDGANFSLPPRPDMHELLALDVLGRTVAISIVIGTASPQRHVQSRAQDLAAQVAAYGAEDLGKIAREFVGAPQNDILHRLWNEGGVEMTEEAVDLASLLAVSFKRDAGDYFEQINRAQRIIIAAEAFTSRVVSGIDWLARAGVDVRGLRYQKFLVGGQEVFFAEQAVPRSDPAIDSSETRQITHEAIEPWKTKGLAYYLDLLAPAVGNILERLLIESREETFSSNWAHKFYFWLRGSRRTLRIRTYYRDRLEIGFHNHSVEAVTEFLRNFRLPGVEVYIVGGYADSPFISLASGMDVNEEWSLMIRSWLSGKLDS